MLGITSLKFLYRDGRGSGTRPIRYLADLTRTLWVRHFLTLIRPAYQRVPDYRISAEIGSGQWVLAPPHLLFNFFQK